MPAILHYARTQRMNNRERNKDYNRRKILASARHLLLDGGLNALSMRALAEHAQVSSRTPYNLFGSKTDVLMGLLDEPLHQMIAALPTVPPPSIILGSFSLIERAYGLYAPEIDYYREIYWGVMSSEHHSAREKYLVHAQQWILPLLKQARDAGELKSSTNIEALARHITLTLIGFLGLWASGLINGPDLISQLKQTLAFCFFYGSSEPVQHSLKIFIDEI